MVVTALTETQMKSLEANAIVIKIREVINKTILLDGDDLGNVDNFEYFGNTVSRMVALTKILD